MPRELFVTVGTGRDREDIGKALALSIRHHRADRVWCLATFPRLTSRGFSSSG